MPLPPLSHSAYSGEQCFVPGGSQRVLPMIGFILKVFIASTLLSCAIKYGGIYLPVQGNTPTALIAVLTPSILMAILFIVRGQRGAEGMGGSQEE